MLKSILLSVIAVTLLVAGIVGLVVPVIPGVLLLIAAALCASAVSPAIRQRLHRHPSLRKAHRRWQASSELAFAQRLRLAFWLSADVLADSLPAMRRRR